LPAQHVVDAGYMRARNMVESQALHGVDLVGPVATDHQWQAKTAGAFDVTRFMVDWERRTATCPQGERSIRWCETRTARGRVMIHIDFSSDDYTPCPVRSLCTRAKTIPRTLTLQVQEEHEAIQRARYRQTTDEYITIYARRAGIEGTMSQGGRAFGLRQARYRGLAKVHLQDVATATALNVARLDDWLNAVPLAQTRCSRFAALAHLN
jgi:transposase